jgi:membrane fusion protein, heavy metal efflux system
MKTAKSSIKCSGKSAISHVTLALIVSVSLFISGCGESAHKEIEANRAGASKDKHEAEKGRIKLSAEAIKNAGIKTVIVNAEALPDLLSVTANISHNQDRVFHVTPRIRGRVVEVYVSLGSSVGQGTRLALLDSTELGESKAEYLKAKTLLELAKANYEREKSLFDQKIAAQKDVLAAEADYRKAEAEVKTLNERLRLFGLSDEAIANLDSAPSRYVILSPGPGVIVEREISQGEVIEAGKKVFTVSDLSAVWVLLNVYEKDLAKIKVGMPVKIMAESYPGEVFNGKVVYINDTVDPQSRTVPVRVVVPNPGRRLKPGMFATAEIQTPASTGTIFMIPPIAVQKIEGKSSAFVQEGEGNFLKRDLELGRSMGGKVEVKSGLKEGEQVVTEGSFVLKSELLKGEGEAHGH